MKTLSQVSGVDWNVMCTPLYQVVMMGNAEALEILMSIPGVDFRTEKGKGETLALAAARSGSLECCSLLKSKPEVDWEKKDNNGNSPEVWLQELFGELYLNEVSHSNERDSQQPQETF